MTETNKIIAPLSFAQERLWFIDKYQGGGYAYNVPFIIKISGEFYPLILAQALKKLLERQEGLRTIFKSEGEETYQHVLNIEPEWFNNILTPIKTLKELELSLQADIQYIFDLSSELLIRIKLYQLKDDEYYLSIVMHHIISDAWSIGILARELGEFYNSILRNKEPLLIKIPPLDISYRDYSKWQRDYLREGFGEHLEFWTKKLTGHTIVEFPTDKPRSQEKTFNGRYVDFELSDELVENLKKYCKNNGYTLNVVLMGVFQILLSKYSSNTDIVIGTVVANRSYSQIENLIGFFVNTLAIRSEVVGKLKEYYNQLNSNLIDSYRYQELPFEALVNHLSIQRDISRNPIFDFLFIFQNSEQFNLDFLGATATEYQIKPNVAKFDITLFIQEKFNKIIGSFEYNYDIYNEDSIYRLAERYKYLLEQILSNNKNTIDDLKIILPSEYQNLIFDWNHTQTAYPHDKTLHQLFVDQVKKTPDQTALIFLDKKMTYAELEEKSNQLARLIRKIYQEKNKKEMSVNVMIPLCIKRGLHMVIAILGVLKAGGAYVPIDPEYSHERIRFILDDIDSKILLTEHLLEKKLNKNSSHLLFLDDEEYLNEEKIALEDFNNSQSLAYVLYTSGTTGTPKGVMLTHNSVVNRILQMIKISDVKSKDHYLFKTNYVFDVSVSDLFVHLSAGATLTITKNEFDLIEISDFVQNHNNASMHLVPSQFFLVEKEILSNNLTKIYFSGEELTSIIVDKLKNKEIINYYGPTETGEITYYQPKTGNEAKVIGKVFQNNKIYVLDNKLNPVPIGVIGELYVSGVGLANGYLNRHNLTQERFIINPFATEEDKIMGYANLYKTGDLVKWLPNGCLEFIGRNDDQVKIRGFRIELAGIKTVLEEHPDITQAVILVKERNENKYLVAYYLSKEPISSEELTDHLAEVLPDYMIPTTYVHLKTMPLNINGKLDRKALPEPQFKDETSNYLAPKTDMEIELVSIWEDLLGIKKIGTNDNFFRLGGNSILAIRLANKITEHFKCNCPVREIFRKNTISNLAAYIYSFSNQNNVTTNIAEEYKIIADWKNQYLPFPLTRVQEAYLLGRSNLFNLGNISSHIYTEIEFEYLDINRLEASLNKLIQRHLGLRTIFTTTKQVVLKEVPYYTIKVYDLTNENQHSFALHLLKMRDTFSHQVFNPEVFPIFSIVVTKHNNYILHISLDALIFDAHSTRIFIAEWTEFYNTPEKILPEIGISFRDYVVKLCEIEKSKEFAEDKQYWLEKIPKMDIECSLPLRKKPAEITQPIFARKSKKFSKDIWDKLKEKSISANVSSTTLLLSIYALVLLRWSGNKKILINLTLFDRLPLHKDVEKVLGDFTILEIFSFVKNNEESFKDTVLRVQDQLWTDLQHKLFSGMDVQREIKKINNLDVERSVAPLVFTSVLGLKSEKNEILDPSFKEVIYSITQTSQIWIDNKAYEEDGKLVAEWDYVEQLLDQETITNMHEAYCYLIEYFASHDWGDKIPDLLPKKDFKLIKDNNDTYFEKILPTKCIHESFIETAVKYPDKVAIISRSGDKTYQELKEIGCRITHCLKKNDITSNTIVAIYCEKGWEEIASCLGIMLAKAAYLPLNIEWPIMRIKKILKDANCKYLLTTTNFSKHLQDNLENVAVIAIDSESVLGCSPELPCCIGFLDNIAYVIFTSGSTGDPKGVVITHKNAMNTINDINYRFSITSDDKIFALSKLSFDLSVYDIFGMLSAGGTIVMPDDKEYKSPEVWFDLLISEGITVWNSVPMLMSMLIEHLKIADHKKIEALKKTLKLILLSGDRIPPELPEMIKTYMPTTQIISLGGATEGSIWSILYPITDLATIHERIPYGKAMYNQTMYVLNDDLEYCPVGVLGEIYIGGIGVAQGYWNNEEQTSLQFVNSPNTRERLYKTGDLGRILPDGNIEFLGRKDSQVKVGGYRVELGEIENTISKFPFIKECAVSVLGNPPHQKLIGYIVSEAAHDDKLQFKLKRLGIQRDRLKLDDTIKLSNAKINEDEKLHYFSRKSYRRFEKEWLDISIIEACLNVPTKTHNDLITQKSLDVFECLSLCLRKYISCFEAGLIFPKYRYPSAGGLYPMQVYVYLPHALLQNNAKQGLYYYHPDQHQLIYIDKQTKIKNDELSFYFYGYLPAIEPEYGQASLPFCFLETGYMLQLLQDSLQNMGLFLKQQSLPNFTECFGDEYILTGSYVVGIETPNEKSNATLPIYLIDKQQPEWKIYLWKKHHFDLIKIWKPLDPNLSNNGANKDIIEEAAYLLILGNDDANKIYIDSGKITQEITEKLIKYKIGSCLLGFLELDEVMSKIINMTIVHTTIALGKVTEEDIASKNIILSHYSERKKHEILEERIKKEAINILPEYMIPAVFIELNEMPLNASGKVNRKVLASYELPDQDNNSYLAPRYDLEKQLVSIWQELLTLDNIGIKDNFFRLGGDSLLAIKLVNQVEEKLNKKIKISDVFIAKTIEELAKILTDTNSLIKCFNKNSKIKKNIIMIHPGSGGCEVYSELANLLQGHFNCYGLDNYNIENEDKITQLDLLANKYISYLRAENLLLSQPILLGWSLGGEIALQMATVLEKEFPKINIYLLDTILSDDKIKKDSDKISRIEFEESKINALKKAGHDDKYIKAVFAAYETENFLSKQIPSQKLDTAIAVLFKALKKDETVQDHVYHRLYEYVLKLPDNNISSYLKEKLQIISLDCHHLNILDLKKFIANKIISLLSKAE